MSRSGWIFAVLTFAAPPVDAEIFKCATKDGMPLYQNFPCELDSLGWLPSAPNAGTTAPASKGGATPAVKPASDQATPKVKTAVAPTVPRLGMTGDEVREVWGEPASTYQDELVDGRVEFWSYGGERSVKFDARGRVVSVQR
jgi:hypothetical protein